MSFRHDMRGKTPQQQAIVRQRDREERRRKEEAEKRKKQERAQNSVEYSFHFDDVKNYLSEDEYERLLKEVHRYKDTIIKHLLIEEDRGNETLRSEERRVGKECRSGWAGEAEREGREAE